MNTSRRHLPALATMLSLHAHRAPLNDDPLDAAIEGLGEPTPLTMLARLLAMESIPTHQLQRIHFTDEEQESARRFVETRRMLGEASRMGKLQLPPTFCLGHTDAHPLNTSGLAKLILTSTPSAPPRPTPPTSPSRERSAAAEHARALCQDFAHLRLLEGLRRLGLLKRYVPTDAELSSAHTTLAHLRALDVYGARGRAPLIARHQREGMLELELIARTLTESRAQE